MKKSMLVLGLSLLSMVSFSKAQAADDWRHVGLRSSEGPSLVVDYQIAKQCQYFSANGRMDNEVRLAEPVWFNVNNLPLNAQVTVDVEFYSQSYINHGGPNPIVRSY